MSVAESEFNADAGEEAASAPARSRAETRRRLVAAATELFAAEGLHGVTSARIARRAGVATGTFYLHFKDKRVLFREIAFDALERLRRRQAAAASRSGDPAAELRARTRELLAFAEENQSLVRVLFGRDREAAGLGDDVLDQVVPGIERRLRERRASGALAPELHPGLAAQALAAMTTRLIAWWIEHPERATRDEVLETLLRLHPLHSAPAAPDPTRPS